MPFSGSHSRRFFLIQPHEPSDARSLVGLLNRHAIGCHDGGVILLMGFKEFWGHGQRVVEILSFQPHGRGIVIRMYPDQTRAVFKCFIDIKHDLLFRIVKEAKGRYRFLFTSPNPGIYA